MFIDQIGPFISKHWPLILAWVMIAAVWILYEIRNQKSGGNRLSPIELVNKINHDESKVIDIRPSKDFNDGHIIGSINIPYQSGADYLHKFDKLKGKRLVIVCAHGQSATQVATQLRKEKESDFSEVSVLKGGLFAWRGANLPLTKD